MVSSVLTIMNAPTLVCQGNATCTNIQGSFNCTCLDGYDGDGFEGNSTEIDECSTGDHECDADATWDNLPCSQNCTCNEGYAGVDGDCTDVDECDLRLDRF